MSEADVHQELLQRAAERACAQPFFLGSALTAFAAAEGLDNAGLANRLACTVFLLPRLALCRRPAGQTFASDVQRIAERFEVDPLKLAELLRTVEALDALERAWAGESTTSVPGGGWLAAARDRDEPPTESSALPDSTQDPPR